MDQIVDALQTQVQKQIAKLESEIEVVDRAKSDGEVRFDYTICEEILNGLVAECRALTPVATKLVSICQKLADARADRKKARGDVEKAFDNGDRAGLDDAMNRIAEAKSKSEHEGEQLARLYSKLEGPFDQHKKLRKRCGDVQGEIARAEDILKVWKRRAELLVGQCGQSLSEKNQLRELIRDAQTEEDKEAG